jgi:WD40 repeat protein
LTTSEKGRVIDAVTSIAGHTRKEAEKVTSVAAAVVGNQFYQAAGYIDGKIVMRHRDSGKWESPEPLDGYGRVRCLRFSPEGRFLLAGTGNLVLLWDIRTQIYAVLRDPTRVEYVWDVAFSPDGRYALAASGTLDMDFDNVLKLDEDGKPMAIDCLVRVWDLGPRRESLRSIDTSNVITRFARSAAPVRSVVVAPDGRTVFSGSGGGANYRWPEGHAVEAIDCTIWQWDLQTGREIARFAGHKAPVRGLDVSRDGRRLVSCSGPGDETVRLWDIAGAREIAVFRWHSRSVNRVRMSGDGRYSASCDDAGGVLIWRLPDGDGLVPSKNPFPVLRWAVSESWHALVEAPAGPSR